MSWTPEKQRIIKDFLGKALERFPLTIPQNRTNALKWVPICREFDSEYADYLENIIRSYEQEPS